MQHDALRSTALRASLAALAIVLAGCGRDSSPAAAAKDAHVHDSASAPGEHEGHDHAQETGHAHAGDGSDSGHVDEVTLTADAVQRSGIVVAKAQAAVLQPTVFAPARVAFNTEAMAHVGSPLHGRVSELKARVGDSVRAGDDLLAIESIELGEAQAEFLQRRNAVQAAGPAVELARVALERGRALREKSQGITLAELQRREAEHKAAMAAQRSAETAAVAAEARLRVLGMGAAQVEALASTGKVDPRQVVRAPIAGTVVQREATLGELVGPDRDALFVIADTGTLWVLADVPEARIGGIAVGNKAWLTIGAPAAAGAVDAGGPIAGAVSFIAPLVDPATRTVQVRIDAPSRAGGRVTLRPGMFAQAEIAEAGPGEHPEPQVAVPEDAVQLVEGGPAVFVPVKDEPNTFAKRALTIGKPVGGMVPVLAGLAAGEDFVVHGAFVLKAELGKGSAAHEH